MPLASEFVDLGIDDTVQPLPTPIVPVGTGVAAQHSLTAEQVVPVGTHVMPNAVFGAQATLAAAIQEEFGLSEEDVGEFWASPVHGELFVIVLVTL